MPGETEHRRITLGGLELRLSGLAIICSLRHDSMFITKASLFAAASQRKALGPHPAHQVDRAPPIYATHDPASRPVIGGRLRSGGKRGRRELSSVAVVRNRRRHTGRGFQARICPDGNRTLPRAASADLSIPGDPASLFNLLDFVQSYLSYGSGRAAITLKHEIGGFFLARSAWLNRASL